jgi:cytochrome c oxidase subunit 4
MTESTSIETPVVTGEHHAHHPTERQYILVAVVLAVLTAIEVALYYVDSLNDDALVAMLGILAVAKFVMVVMYFMHLRFDSPVFRRFFVTGVVLAVAVYIVVLATFHVFSGDAQNVLPGA